MSPGNTDTSPARRVRIAGRRTAMAHATYFASSTEPKRLPAARESLGDFVQRHAERRIALVTSGGTTVPLEKNTVRFIDNFSTGNRGAASVEQLLKADYAVVFVYRTHSAFPSWFTPRRSGIRRAVRRGGRGGRGDGHHRSRGLAG